MLRCLDLLLPCLALSLCGLVFFTIHPEAFAEEPLTPEEETVVAAPVLADGILYIASFSRAAGAGHLRAIDITGSSAYQLWDAAERIPLPGTGAAPGSLTDSDPPQLVDPTNLYRTLFTNLATGDDEHQLPFAATQSAALQASLAVPTLPEAAALINRVRGRVDATPELVAGSGDAAHRLWPISRSTPAVAGRSLLAENAAERDQVVYAGAEDGMLHAFHAGWWDPLLNSYNQTDPVAGQELWAYIPGGLLSWLQFQPFDDEASALAVHIDGSPAIGDYFLDQSGDGRRQWHSLLVGTGSLSATNRSVIFALDVTDPCQPDLLWERFLPGTNLGLTKGAVIGNSTAGAPQPDIYLTTGYAVRTDSNNLPDPLNGDYGIQAAALDLMTGSLQWQWYSAYDAPLTDINTTPAQAALMDVDGDGAVDYLIFGDMAGRLWAIAADNGLALGGAPLYTDPEGAAQPIGAGVAIYGRIAIFGTGGAEHADDNGSYAIHAVEILPSGGQLLWSYPLEPGEKVWDRPVVDRFGRIYFAASTGYLPDHDNRQETTGGRLVILDKTGQEQSSTVTDSAVAGRIEVGPGLAVAVSLSGQVYQFGTVHLPAEEDAAPAGSVRLYSWRLR